MKVRGRRDHRLHLAGLWGGLLPRWALMVTDCSRSRVCCGLRCSVGEVFLSPICAAPQGGQLRIHGDISIKRNRSSLTEFYAETFYTMKMPVLLLFFK